MTDTKRRSCPSWVVHNGATWRCGLRRGHGPDHVCIGVQHPRDAMNYQMKWSDPEPYNEPVGEVDP